MINLQCQTVGPSTNKGTSGELLPSLALEIDIMLHEAALEAMSVLLPHFIYFEPKTKLYCIKVTELFSMNCYRTRKNKIKTSRTQRV